MEKPKTCGDCAFVKMKPARTRWLYTCSLPNLPVQEKRVACSLGKLKERSRKHD
jgi:hypothetical protein